MGQPRKLSWPDAQDNLLTALPAGLARLSALVTLNPGWQQPAVPGWLAGMSALTSLYVARNPLDDMPRPVTGRFGSR